MRAGEALTGGTVSMTAQASALQLTGLLKRFGDMTAVAAALITVGLLAILFARSISRYG